MIVEIPIVVQRVDGKEGMLTVQAYVIDVDVPFLCGKWILELWDSRLDTKRKILGTNMDSSRKEFRTLITVWNHYGVVLDTKGRKNMEVMFLKVE